MGFYNVLPGEHIYILGISLQRLGSVAVIRVKNEQREIAATALERRVMGLFWYRPLDKVVVTGWQLTDALKHVQNEGDQTTPIPCGAGKRLPPGKAHAPSK